MNFYNRDLANIHATGFCDFINKISLTILKTLRQNHIDSGHIIDLGCGSGNLAKILTKKGYKVTGVDISPEMIKIAKNLNIKNATFIESSLYDFSFPPCVALTAMGEVLNYISNNSNPKKQLPGLFNKIYEALLPGGLFMFDISEPGRGEGVKQRFWETKNWTILVDYAEDKFSEQLTRKITTFTKKNSLYHRGFEIHKLQLFKATIIAKKLRQIGFKIRIVRNYGDFKLSKAHALLIAHK